MVRLQGRPDPVVSKQREAWGVPITVSKQWPCRGGKGGIFIKMWYMIGV